MCTTNTHFHFTTSSWLIPPLPLFLREIKGCVSQFFFFIIEKFCHDFFSHFIPKGRGTHKKMGGGGEKKSLDHERSEGPRPSFSSSLFLFIGAYFRQIWLQTKGEISQLFSSFTFETTEVVPTKKFGTSWKMHLAHMPNFFRGENRLSFKHRRSFFFLIFLSTSCMTSSSRQLSCRHMGRKIRMGERVRKL